jgi:hypothetical protein
MWSKIEKGLEATNKQMKSITNNQIMVQAPSPLRETYFANLYQTIAAEVANHHEMVELQTRELEVKERSCQLQEAMLCATDSQNSNDQMFTKVESPIAI